MALVWLFATLGTLEEMVLRQPRAYLGPGGGPPEWAAHLAALAGAISGGAIGYFERRHIGRGLLFALLSVALSSGTSGALYFWAFDRGSLLALVALGVPLLAVGALSATTVLGGFAFFPVLARSGVVTRWARPLPLLAVGLLFGLGAALAAHAGMLRAAATIGLIWMALAWWQAMEFAELRFWAWVSGGCLIVGLAGLAQSHRLVPGSDLGHHRAEVVAVRSRGFGHYLVTSAQEHFNLFVDGRLEVSSLDEHRYHEALVHPAMQSARRRARVLVLGGGKGPAEREILRYPEVEQVVVILHDRTLFDLARGMRWLAQRSRYALSDARVQMVEAEPIVWLAGSGAPFDVAIVDLADPSGYFEGKNFSRFFYRELGRRVARDGVIVVQATSPLHSPRTFALIESTLEAAGWSTLPYHAPVVTLGDWGFVLAARRPLEPPTTVPQGMQFLSPGILAELFHLPRDVTRPVPGPPNVLDHQRLVDLFEQEQP